MGSKPSSSTHQLLLLVLLASALAIVAAAHGDKSGRESNAVDHFGTSLCQAGRKLQGAQCFGAMAKAGGKTDLPTFKPPRPPTVPGPKPNIPGPKPSSSFSSFTWRLLHVDEQQAAYTKAFAAGIKRFIIAKQQGIIRLPVKGGFKAGQICGECIASCAQHNEHLDADSCFVHWAPLEEPSSCSCKAIYGKPTNNPSAPVHKITPQDLGMLPRSSGGRRLQVSIASVADAGSGAAATGARAATSAGAMPAAGRITSIAQALGHPAPPAQPSFIDLVTLGGGAGGLSSAPAVNKRSSLLEIAPDPQQGAVAQQQPPLKGPQAASSAKQGLAGGTGGSTQAVSAAKQRQQEIARVAKYKTDFVNGMKRFVVAKQDKLMKATVKGGFKAGESCGNCIVEFAKYEAHMDADRCWNILQSGSLQQPFSCPCKLVYGRPVADPAAQVRLITPQELGTVPK